jgi:hypothetical protein
MAKGDHKFETPPTGSTYGGYARPRVQIGFDREQIETITERAKANNRSFAAEVRALVATALTAERT